MIQYKTWPVVQCWRTVACYAFKWGYFWIAPCAAKFAWSPLLIGDDRWQMATVLVDVSRYVFRNGLREYSERQIRNLVFVQNVRIDQIQSHLLGPFNGFAGNVAIWPHLVGFVDPRHIFVVLYYWFGLYYGGPTPKVHIWAFNHFSGVNSGDHPYHSLVVPNVDQHISPPNDSIFSRRNQGSNVLGEIAIHPNCTVL